MNQVDVRAAVSIYAANKAPQILSRITGKPPETFEIKEQGIKVLKRGLYSSVASLILGYRDKTTQHIGEKRVLIKYFGKGNGERKAGYKDLAQSTIDTCNFLSGIGDFPKCYFHEETDIGTFLGLQQIGNTTLNELTTKYKGDSLRYTLQGVFPYVSRFQINATKSLERWIDKKEATQQKFFNIFGRRASAKRILDYLRAVKEKAHVDELDKNLVKSVLDFSVPIQKMHTPRKDNFRVIHGDLISKNIIIYKESEQQNEQQKYGFIDAEPAIAFPTDDLSGLLATSEMDLRPSDWKALTDVFLCNDGIEEFNANIDLPKVRERLVSKLENLGVKFTNDEPPGNPYFYTFMGLFFRAGRIEAKVKDLKLLHPEIYKTIADDDPTLNITVEEMKKKMSLSLGEVVRDPSTFGVSRDEYISQLIKFYNVLGTEGVIDAIKTSNNCPHSLFQKYGPNWREHSKHLRELNGEPENLT